MISGRNPKRMQIHYYGQSAFVLEAEDGTRLIIDPWIEENPHTDATAEDITDVDGVLVTHGGFDHFGDAPAIAIQNDAIVYTDFATYQHLQMDENFPDGQVRGYIYGAEITGGGWSARVVLAHHISAFFEEGLMGPALGFVISMDDEVVYHMGDTSIFSDIQLYADLYEPTVSLIPVGPAEPFFSELPPDEAAVAADWLDSETIIPMHYPPDGDHPHRFKDYCDERGVTEHSDVTIVKPNTTYTV